MDDKDVTLKRLERIDAEVAALRQESLQLRLDNRDLRVVNQRLRDQIAALKKNSSKPLSSDIVSPPKPTPPRGTRRSNSRYCSLGVALRRTFDSWTIPASSRPTTPPNAPSVSRSWTAA